MPMPYQLSYIAVLWRRHPELGEVIFQHELQQVLRVPAIVFLLAHLLGSDLRWIADPYFKVQLS